MDESMAITLGDVAREAGVSRATVDRVINKRPGVREPTLRRVQAAMEKLDYRPDPIAARLARGTRYRFRFILPAGRNTFMEGLRGQIEATARWLRRQRGFIDLSVTDVFDARALAATLRETDRALSGVAVVALDDPLVRAAIDEVSDAGIPVVTLVSDVPSSRRARFVGIDNAAAGRTAASLVGRFVGRRGGTVGVLAGSLALRDHMERCFGFAQVMEADFPQLKLLPVREMRDEEGLAREAVEAMVRDVPDLVALYNAGAGNGGIGAALRASALDPRLAVVGHELTDDTRRLLAEGLFDALIAQDPGHEARSAARVLLAIASGEAIMAEQERIRIDVFLRDNLP